MANNTLLGAIDLQYSGGGVVATDGPTSLPYSPTDGNITPVDTIQTGGGMVTLPTDGVTYFEGGPSGGGGASMPAPESPAAEIPAETSQAPKLASKKNLLLFGIGGLVLAYLLFRKK